MDINMSCTPRVLIGPLSGFASGIPSGRGTRALLVADKALENRAEDIQDSLDSSGIKTILFSREGLSSNTETLNEVLSLARGAHADIIGAIGGEKALSLGRLTAAAAGSMIRAEDFMSGGIQVNQGLPLFEVPSSGRHTLLFRREALLTDAESGRIFLVQLGDTSIITDLIDPSITAQLSARASALSLSSVLFSAVESFLSPRSDFFSDTQSRAALGNAAKLLRRVKAEAADPDFRIREAENGVLAAFSTGLTAPGPGTMLSWAVSAASGSSKAAVSAVLLPWVLESPLYSGSPKLKELAGLIAESPTDASDNPAEEVRSLFGFLGLPGRLRELGVELDGVQPAAGRAVNIPGIERPDLNEAVFREILDLSS